MMQSTQALQGRFTLDHLQSDKPKPSAALDQRFSEALQSAITNTNNTIVAGDQASQALAAGEEVGLHETVMAVEKADIALRTFVAVKNRVVEAYQEVMRMQI